MDYFVSLFFLNPSGNYDLYNTTGFIDVGDATYTLSGNILTLTIPLNALGGDDGIADVNTVQGDDVGPTDCVPDEGAAVVTGESLDKEFVLVDGDPNGDFLASLCLTWEAPLIGVVLK